MQSLYQKHPIPELNNNPLTEALRVMENKSEILQHLTKVPLTDISNLSSFYRNARLGSLRNLHIPHQCSVALYHKIMELTLTCYASKNPFEPNVRRATYNIAEEAKKDSYLTFCPTGLTTAPSCLAHGPSGSSKSTTIRHVLSLIPQVISHTKFYDNVFKQDQLVWISFDCPTTPSPKALALNFFKAVDNALGTLYYESWVSKNRESVESHFGHMQLIAITHCIGFVHIDEVQFLLSYAKSKNAPTLQTIESLFNKIGVPLLLTTTSAGLALFEGTELSQGKLPNLTTSRRMLTEREFKFDTFKLDSNMFSELFDALYPSNLCTHGIIPDKNFRKRFHDLSAGLPAVMTRLARLHHEYVLQLNKDTADETLLQKVFKSQFRLIDPALTQLRLGNVMEYENKLPKTKEGTNAWSDDTAASDKQENKVATIPLLEDDFHNNSFESKTNNDVLNIAVGLSEEHCKETGNAQ